MSGMKKTNRPRRLTLQRDTVKTLKIEELAQIVGGVTMPCTHPTTTVLPTGPC
jgi:bacteriocin-like protein